MPENREQFEFYDKGECTDWQLAVNPVGVLRRDSPPEFGRECVDGAGKRRAARVPGGERRVLAPNSFVFLWFKSRTFFFFFHLHNHDFELLTILLGAFTLKSTKNRDNPVTDLLKMFL